MKTKTFLAVLLTATMVLSLCGCGGGETVSDGDTVPTSTTTVTENATTTATTTTVATTTTATTTTAKPTTTKKPADVITTTKSTTTTKKTTTTTTKSTPKTYLEKMGITVSPLEGACLNDSAKHTCRLPNLSIQETAQWWWGESGTPTDINEKDYICLELCRWVFCEFNDVCAFDKYTGTVFSFYYPQSDKPYNRFNINVNGKNISVFVASPAGGGGVISFYICVPKNYDGLMFFVEDKSCYNENDYDEDMAKHMNTLKTIDEIIAFKSSKYYVFSGQERTEKGVPAGPPYPDE